MFGRKGDEDEPAVTDVKDVTDISKYLWILSSASSINSFPLLLSVNEPLHRGVHNKLFAGTLNKPAQIQTNVSLILTDRAQTLNKHLAQAAKVFTHGEYSLLHPAFYFKYNTSRSLSLQHTSSTLRNEYRDNLLASTCFNERTDR